VAAPSGAGKTSLVRALMEREPHLRFSTSYTTRPKRPGEVEGRDYFFVDEAKFREMEAAGEFLEHARVFDNLYGTSRARVESLLAAGHGVILEIDWQGARQVRAAMPEAASIFILPPGLAELERRLRGRETDSESVIRRRLADATADMSHWAEFGHVVINEDFEKARTELEQIILGGGEASDAKRPGLADFVADLSR
jgi:guanylate kinase